MSKEDRQGAWKAGVAVAAVLAATLILGTMLPSLAWAQAAPAPQTHQVFGHQVFFRGGHAALNSNRAGEVFTDVFGRNNQLNDGNTGYYLGAGLDQLMHRDFLGFKGVSLAGEIALELKRFNSKTVTEAVPSTCAAAGIATCSVRVNKVQLTMLTVDVAPKIRFREGSRLRPWIIPVGLDFHVISPPSNQSNYLDIGVQWAAGVEYNVWGPFNLGMDARYHLAANMTNTTNNFGTVGMYVGIGY